MKQDVITMNKKQFNRYEVILRTIDGSLTIEDAAASLNLSARQVKRIKKEVISDGPAALIHKNSLRTPHNALPNDVVQQIISLKTSDMFANCNFTHFNEILEESYDINISYSTLYSILKNHGIDSPKTKRRLKPHRRRSRKSQAGLLLQVDATPFAWFKDDRKKYALHGAIDDATGQVTSLFLTKNECLLGYFEMLKRTFIHFGIPVSIYADRHTIFQSPNSSKADVDSNITCNDTSLGRALKELGVELIAARSPQAKGRIERLWNTLQSRLPVEFELNGINDITSANQFLETYIYKFNSQFAVEPKCSDSLFCPVDNSINLDYILCVKDSRKVDAGGVFSFRGKSFKLPNNEYTKNIYAGSSIDVLSSPSFGVMAQYKGFVLDVIPFIPPKRKKSSPKPPSEWKSTAHPVPLSHPYKFGSAFSSSLVGTRDEIIDMLEDIFLSAY